MPKKTVVVGLGKIGLPLAVMSAATCPTVGVDINSNLVALLNVGSCPYPQEPGLPERLRKTVAEGMFRASTSFEEIQYADVIVVAVPLLLDEHDKPDLGSLRAATDSIGRRLKPGSTVIYETTLPPGTTRNLLGPWLEEASSLKVGEDFSLAFSPERISSGSALADLAQYPKILGGVDARSEEKAKSFYESILDFTPRPDLSKENGVWALGSAEAAEFAKLAETVFRDVNIGLANQFASDCATIGIDFSAIREACNSQPFSHLHKPGIAVGGHCIPVYPWLYRHTFPDAPIVEAARAWNKKYTRRLAQQIVEVLAKENPLIGIMGVSYRGGVKETAYSGAIDLKRHFIDLKTTPVFSDPLFSNDELEDLGFSPIRDYAELDAVVIQADHREYRELRSDQFPNAQLVFDGRGILDKQLWDSALLMTIGKG